MEELKPKNVVNNCTAEASDSAESRPLRQSHAGGKTAIRALRGGSQFLLWKKGSVAPKRQEKTPPCKMQGSGWGGERERSDGFGLVGDEGGFVYAVQREELIEEGFALIHAHLVGDLDAAGGDGLALQLMVAQLLHQLHAVGFAVAAQVHHQQVAVGGLAGEVAQDEDQDGDADDGDGGQEVLTRAQQDAHGERPEHVGGVERVLHGGAEAHDGQRADHAHGELQRVADAGYDGRGDQRHQHQRHAEVGGEHHAAVVFLVHPVDEQTHGERHDHEERDAKP